MDFEAFCIIEFLSKDVMISLPTADPFERSSHLMGEQLLDDDVVCRDQGGIGFLTSTATTNVTITNSLVQGLKRN